jgi:hypothetical protein
MKINILIGFLLISTATCDLLDDSFFLYLLDNALRPGTAGFQPPALIRAATIHLNSAYDALCPYLPDSIGLTTNIPKRPLNERTPRNKNIAIGYAMYRSSVSLLPSVIKKLNNIFLSVGLDYNDNSLDLTTPIGIGNYAAKMVLAYREQDGMNQLGDMGGKKYHRVPYDDYTGYKPKNNAYKIKFPANWQPNFESNGYGTCAIQKHIFPQYGRVLPYSLENVTSIVSPPSPNSDPLKREDYKAQTDEVLRESANLNDYKKMVAEHFDDKSTSLFGPVFFLAQKYQLNQDKIIILDLLTNLALFDAGIVAWKEKINHNLIRPFSAIRYLYENTTFSAWGGPGRGKVDDMTGAQWKSYLPTAAHTEYPSGSACFCAAQFAVLEKYFNTSEFGFAMFKTKGSSIIEPNITPANDIYLGPYPKFDDYVNECAISRLWGGVHFRSSLDEGKRLCKGIGLRVYDYAIKYIRGTVETA